MKGAEEISKDYGIDLKKLEKEQIKLAKQLDIKDSIDFSKVVKVGGCSTIFCQNKMISAIVVIDREFNIIEQKYFSEKPKFPYIPGFRAYRELPSMIKCFNELDEKPEVMFIFGHGLTHSRLGLASHFSLATGIPAIGLADSLIIGEVKGEDVMIDGKLAGKVLETKEGARSVYASPGNLISLESSVKLAKEFTKEPHKMAEPLRLAHKYSRQVMKELI